MGDFFEDRASELANADLHLISLGAGVQSTVMALMAAHGEIEPMPDAAIFADTQWEPAAVYEHLEWLTKQLPFPVYVVSRGNLRNEIVKAQGDTERFVSIPFYTTGGGPCRRQCTREFKIEVIENEGRRLLGYAKGERIKNRMISQWIGISTDEIQRVKESRKKWITHRWPLVEKRISRIDCAVWFGQNYPGRTLPKSACIGCPYHSNAYWAEMKRSDTSSWTNAVETDHMLRSGGKMRGLENEVYMHRSCVPLDEVDFGLSDGQMAFSFDDECEGMCGV